MNQNQKFDQEVDVKFLQQSFKALWLSIGQLIYKFIMIIKRYFLILISLLIFGGAIGYYLDSNLAKSLENTIIVAPNFGIVDYLYESVDNRSFLSKLNDQEKQLAMSIEQIEIVPITDLYSFMETNPISMDVFSIISSKGSDISKLASDYITSKNYRYHQINFVTKEGVNADKIADLIIKKYNAHNSYFSKRSEIENKNLLIKKAEYSKLLDQINNALDKLGSAPNLELEKAIVLNDISSSVELVSAKYTVLDQIKNIDVLLEESTESVYEIDRVLYKAIPSTSAPFAIVLPIVLLGLFFLSIGTIGFVNRFNTVSRTS